MNNWFVLKLGVMLDVGFMLYYTSHFNYL